MSKKTEKLKYEALSELLVDKAVSIGLRSGGVIAGDVEFANKEMIVLVNRPKSALDLETKVVHTIVYQDKVDFIQFKTDRE